MFGRKSGSDHVSTREIRKEERLEVQSYTAFQRGDVFRAMELGRQAAAIQKRELDEYKRNHPHSSRYHTSG